MASYTVKKGDSWWKIAQEQMGSGAKYADLAKYNNMNLNKTIQPGMTINIPSATAKATASPTSAGSVNLAQTNAATGRPSYTQSDAVKNAQTALNNWNSKKPDAYQSKYQSQIDSILDDLINGKKPVYNPYEDPIYQNYKDQYIQGGKMAMQDTMANAAALSGGYGNSYAATAGNQAYQQYLSQLNNVIPELAQLAYERYQDEITGKRNNLNTLQGLEDAAYGRYRDTVSDWNTERDYLTGRYDTEYSRDYGAYRDSVSDWESDRSYNYQKEQDALAQKNWEKEYALSQAQLAASRSGGSSSSSKTSGTSSAWKNKTDAQIESYEQMKEDGESISTIGNQMFADGDDTDTVRAQLAEIGFSASEINTFIAAYLDKKAPKSYPNGKYGNEVQFR